MTKEKFEANVKAEEKLRKIKTNTKLYNEIIEKQLVDGEIVDIDITQDKEMEIFDGGRERRRHIGYGMDDLKK